MPRVSRWLRGLVALPGRRLGASVVRAVGNRPAASQATGCPAGHRMRKERTIGMTTTTEKPAKIDPARLDRHRPDAWTEPPS